ncbi:MAG TPA: 4-hydroxy-tetrahydrodipicolinate synthase [Gammaproteobacteria bacterium]|nr:4-hydroxy-tetrahydrodipicolinate synthase [Gammaproteobacteria bacterium]
MFQGSMVAMVTPMQADGAIDDEGLARLVEFHVENQTDAIIAVGTTGEAATLDHAEHTRVIARIVELANGRIPVIGGTGANSTSEAISLTSGAKAAGVDACLLVTPYYNKPTQEGLYRHYKAIAEAVDVPQILYNVPGRTACDMLPDTVARLAAIPNIVGIKEATGDLDRIKTLVERCGPDFEVYSGEDWLALKAILSGARGVISVTANVAPAQMHDMCTRALDGDADGAKRIDDSLQPLHKALFLESNPIPAKWAVSQLGLTGPGIRLPLTPLSENFHDQVRLAMQTASEALAA